MKANNSKQKGRLPVEMDWVLLSAEGMILPLPSERRTRKGKAGNNSKPIKTKHHRGNKNFIIHY